MKTLILLLLPICTLSQSRYSFELTRCATFTGTGLSYAYGSVVFGEVGLKSNGQEYYTMPYIGGGVQTKGKLYLSISTGYSALLNLPQRDWPVVKEGYTVRVLHCLYVSGRAGYEVLPGVQVYATGTMSGRNWCGVGISLRSK